jgi:Rhamnan synthesis protein F
MTKQSLSLSLHIGLNASRSRAEGWGEFAYAKALIRALEGQGHNAELFYRTESPSLTGVNDVVLRIVGPHLDEPVPNVPNMLWMISPPNFTPLARLRRFQSVYFASQLLVSTYRDLGVNAFYLPQATDTDLFKVDAAEGGTSSHEIVFVGNRASRAPRTNILRAIAQGVDIHVWGAGWDDVLPSGHFQGERLSSPELAQVYAGARIVLNSHMPTMAQLGFMSNRSFDAMACGARVVSDIVEGFNDPSLHGLIQVDFRRISSELNHLETKERSLADRHAIARPVREAYGFDARARTLADAAIQHLLADNFAEPILARSIPKQANEIGTQCSNQNITLHDLDCSDGTDAEQWRKVIASKGNTQSLSVTLQLGDATSTPDKMAVKAAMIRSARAILRIGQIVSNKSNFTQLKVTPPQSEACKGLVHALMPDHRKAQSFAMAESFSDIAEPMILLCEKARRVIEAAAVETHPLAFSAEKSNEAQHLIRANENRPLFPHSPEGFSRDHQKRHLALWPKRNPTSTKRPLGVFLHLFYPELAPLFREKLSRSLENQTRVYISTDTSQKAAIISTYFPEAVVTVFPNRGRDIYPKLFGFSQAYENHDIILHLHGKKSSHSDKLDEWLDHSLACLLPDQDNVQRILSLFEALPNLGMVAPVTYKRILDAAHWGDNLALATELMERMNLKTGLPDDLNLIFPAGSMFWARTKALRPLLDLKLEASHFPPEEGQVDATIAHAIERLFGVVCNSTGHQIIRVAPESSGLYRRYRLTAKSNREVREALSHGEL